jgi:hypothetical protein
MTHLRGALCALVLLGIAAPGMLAGQEHQEREHQEEHKQGEHQEKGHACCGMMSEGMHGMQGMQGMQGMHMQHMDPMMHVAIFAPPHLLEQRAALELTAEQVSHLEELGKELMERHDPAAAEAKAHHEQAMQLWEAEAPDADQLRLHAQAAMRAEETAKLALLTVAAQAKAVLTLEQQKRVVGMHEHMQQMMHEHMRQMMHGDKEQMERHQREP